MILLVSVVECSSFDDQDNDMLWQQKIILMNAKIIFLHSTDLKFVLEIKA